MQAAFFFSNNLSLLVYYSSAISNCIKKVAKSMENENYQINYLKFNSNQATAYSRPAIPFFSTKQKEAQEKNLKKESYKARGLSSASSRKIKSKVQALYFLKKIDYVSYLKKNKKTRDNQEYKKVIFVTLTLPAKQKHDDNYIKKHYLNQFLIELQQKTAVDLYLWRAEKQKNGNIHFHLIINKNVHWAFIRRLWNRILGKGENSYISDYSTNQKAFFSNGFKLRNDGRSEQKQREAYKRGINTGFTDPNSTDIKEIKNEKAINNYISKYMSKNEKSDENDFNVTGKIWGCSRELSSISEKTIIIQEWQANHPTLWEEIDKELAQSHKIKIEEECYNVTLFFNDGHWKVLEKIIASHYVSQLTAKGYAISMAS